MSSPHSTAALLLTSMISLYYASNNHVVHIHLQDTDFTALLQDIASGPSSLSELSCKPDEAQESSRPSSEGEKDNMADSASEDVAAASLSAERKSLRQRFNPMRGFLSRRSSSVSLPGQPSKCFSSFACVANNPSLGARPTCGFLIS